MSRRMLSEQTWREIGEALVALDGDGPTLLRVLRKSFPAHALGFVPGGVS